MKVSVKLQDHHQNHHKSHHSPPLLLRAKLPITILNLPFLSHFSTTTTHPSDLSLALSTNFPSGPSLKLSYATASPAASTPPITLSLKSGTGVFGSPKNSPLVISANFSFNPSNPNPTFSLLFKPQLGSFSLRKSTCSHSKPIPDVGSDSNSINGDVGLDSGSYAFVPLDKPVVDVNDLSLERKESDSIFKGFQLAANTHFPVANRAALNLRWWMDFPADKMPVLRINKFGIERVEKTVNEVDERKSEGSNGEVEALKGMYLWMQRELDGLSRANREMKCELAELRVGRAVRHGGDVGGNVRKKVMLPAAGGATTSGFEEWKKKKNSGGYDNGNVKKKEEDNFNKSGSSLAMDVESELQRAIKAASGSS